MDYLMETQHAPPPNRWSPIWARSSALLFYYSLLFYGAYGPLPFFFIYSWISFFSPDCSYPFLPGDILPFLFPTILKARVHLTNCPVQVGSNEPSHN